VGVTDHLGDTDEIADFDVEAGFLLDLARQGAGKVLAELDPAAGN
jgi:hypothetical protein